MSCQDVVIVGTGHCLCVVSDKEYSGLVMLSQALFRRGQLKALVDVHGSTAGFGGTLTEEETHIIKGALDLTQKTAMKSMTPLDKLFMLSTDDRLDEKALHMILLSGHSRIPVYRGGNR